VNGWIRTLPWTASHKVTIMNNEFDNRLAGNGPAIRLDARGLEGIVRNNIIRRSGAEDGPGFKDAAIHILADPRQRMIVEGNLVDGWLHALSCRPKKPSGDPATYLIRNNTISGAIALLGPPGQFLKYVRNNLNLTTFQPVEEGHIPGREFKDEEYKM